MVAAPTNERKTEVVRAPAAAPPPNERATFPPPGRSPSLDRPVGSTDAPTAPSTLASESPAEGKEDSADSAASNLGGERDFGFLPIPKQLQWDNERPPEFTLLLNVIMGVAATFSVASLYYPQTILIAISEEYKVSYSTVVDIPTLLQASYALGIIFISPCGDLIRRRPLLLLLTLASSLLTLILALVPSILAFQVISFFLGAASVTPQILLPLAGDLARPERRASALSIVLSGLILGILVARVLAGVVTQGSGSVKNVYFMSFGLQVFIGGMLYCTVPDYPAKNKHMSYWQVLRSMAKLAVTEPVLIQSCVIACLSSAQMSSFWNTSTFLLGDVFHFSTEKIGLFALVGVVGVMTAPVVGRLIDGMVPWLGILLGIGMLTIAQAVFTGAGGVSIGAVVVVIIFIDIGQQLQQVSNSTRVFAISAEARSRLNAPYIFSIFVGQLIGTAAGTRIYLHYGGYRASGAFGLAILAAMTFVLCLRGPHLPMTRWFGWEGGFLPLRARPQKREEDVDGQVEKQV